MSKWINCTLSDIGEIIGGATPATKKEEYYSGNISWITPKDLSSFKGRYIEKGERNITELGLNACSAQLMPKGTVLFTSRAPIGYIAIAEKEVCTNQGFKSIVAKENVTSLFLYYLLVYNKDNIEALGSGTTFKEVSGKTMKSVPVTIPENIEEQQQIANLLDKIDSKIELNNKINDNLEQQAQSIFKSWFIDFKPFGGVMPSDWEVLPLSDVTKIVTKGTTPTTLGKQFQNQGISFIKVESILDNHSFDKSKFAYIDEETNVILKRSIIEDKDIVFTIAGTLGRFALVSEDILPCNTNQAVAIIRTETSVISAEYLYSFFLGNWHNDYYSKRIQQAVQANLSLTTIKSLPITIANNQDKQRYENLIIPILKNITINQQQNQKLAQLRDTLLPKLMSGEIDISEVEI